MSQRSVFAGVLTRGNRRPPFAGAFSNACRELDQYCAFRGDDDVDRRDCVHNRFRSRLATHRIPPLLHMILSSRNFMYPHQNAPDRSFWSRSVSSGFDVRQLTDHDGPLIRPGEPVASAGSCFASNLVPFLERAGFEYLRTERRNPAFSNIRPENLGYENFSAAYGDIYTPRQLLQLLRRCLGSFKPAEDRWHKDAGVIDPFRPGLRYHALTDREFDLLGAQHLRAVRRVFEEAKVFIFTLGLTEAWVSRLDGAVFPACPGTIAGTFDEALHAFVNFSVDEVTSDLDAFVTELRALNRGVRIILTVSPVPLVATATGKHVLPSSTYSKAVLRASAEEIVRRHAFVSYFPAFEIVTGPQAPDAYLEADRRSVTQEAIATVMTAFLAACEAADEAARVVNAPREDGDVPTDEVASGPAMFDTTRLDQAGGIDGIDPDPIAELGRRAAGAGLRTASLDEIPCQESSASSFSDSPGGRLTEYLVLINDD